MEIKSLSKPRTECSHPDDLLIVEMDGGLSYSGGDVNDDLRDVVICQGCGAVLDPDPGPEDILF